MQSHLDFALRPSLRELRPYAVPASQGMIKLDAMENPFPLPHLLQKALAERLAKVAVNRYPDASLFVLKQGLRTLMSIPDEVEIVAGNGSDEIIQLLIMAVASPNAIIMGVDPSFVMYRLISQWLGLRYIGIPLQSDFSMDTPALLKNIQTHQPALIFLAYPNNPSGNCFDEADIETIIKAAPGLVVIDEAYYAFTEKSFLPKILNYPNVVIVRTVSKLGMAGLRIGCALGNKEWIHVLEGLRLPYNINSLTQASFEVLVEHRELFNQQTHRILLERETLFAQLKTLRGIEDVWPSECNFLLFRVMDAPHVYTQLKAQGILIKLLHGAHPLLEHVLRVSIGTPAENTQFLATLHAILLAQS